MPEFEVEGRIPAMTLMSGNLVPETKMYVEAGWIVNMPNPNPHIQEHTHDYDEIVIHVGIDPQNPEELGDELDFYMEGKDDHFESTNHPQYTYPRESSTDRWSGRVWQNRIWK